MDFTDQVAVVTGAGRNLGRAYALEFARAGAAVVVNDAGITVAGTENDDAKVADAVVKEITDAGGRAVASYDLVDTVEGGQNIVEIAIENFGRVDAIVANAGNRRADWFGEIDPGDFTALLNTHLGGILHVSQAAWPVMKEQKYGRFLLTSSSAGLFGFPGTGAYATAKAGVVGLVNTMALEGEEHGILVNGLLPTAPTERGKEAHGKTYLSPLVQRGAEAAASHEDWMSPEEMAPFVVASCSSDWKLTQKLFSVTGGRIAEVFAGVTKGWYAPDYHSYTPEEVIAAQDEICDRTEYAVPRVLTEEVVLVDRWRP